MTLHFFVARKADGAPLFMQIQPFLGSVADLRKSIATSLLCRGDVDHATIHQVNADMTFSLVERLEREASTGFYQCAHCPTLVYETYRCERCGDIVCKEHRREDPKKMLAWLCTDCAATQ